MSLNTLVLILAVFVLCMANVMLGRHWSRLDHNPWSRSSSDRVLDIDPEVDSEPVPGWNPGTMDVAKIRQRGRQLMIAAPIASVVFVVVVMVSSSRF
ncbi:hypothetical protein C8J45_10760 [Sphingomonas sp. PP-CE-3G-477]|uniref:hypothetical protein n=1 Tax=unclassified Sphingomonas TaxID=196159 RepID=UPI000D3DB1DB|nr:MULTISPECIES: hypothetical protein [unclassified Sphingomonas]MBD8618676.1 hypothetical protein [Sphingomonas sp. CFBP 13728]MBE2993247.1 hypothetical protein [Sphingomonas sp. CFBP 13603]PTQ63073.1 hypothetical protein C8J45_10760 [Sphingomonas sp. PP-CE-3G-477]